VIAGWNGQIYRSVGTQQNEVNNVYRGPQWRTQKFFFGWGVQQIQLTEGRDNRDLGAVAPHSGVPPNLQVGETCIIIISFLRCTFHGTGNSARLCQNFGIISGGFEPPKPPPLGTPVTPINRSIFQSIRKAGVYMELCPPCEYGGHTWSQYSEGF
jgi:hypothetical protein